MPKGVTRLQWSYSDGRVSRQGQDDIVLCDGFFAPEDFDPELEDEIIHYIRSNPFLSKEEKKWLIICWYRVTFGGEQIGPDAQQRAREAMQRALKKLGVRNFDDIL
jgi:RimJ/RimL family protein N-acetyltransferase